MNKPNNDQRLGHRVAKGGLWVFALRITQQLSGLARLLILARILAPHDFGVLGIAMLTLATLETFAQTGFDAALIQRKDDIKGYLDTVWTVSILRGLILFTILYLAAPYAAAFFSTPEAALIMQVIGMSFLINAFTNVGVLYFQKELDFKRQYVYQLSSTVVDFIVAVSAALILRNVWALVYGLLAGNVVRCVVSYCVHPYRPRLSFDLEKAKELFGFGKWVFASSILIFLLTQGDDAFVGKFLGASALGFYQLAYRLSNLPATEVTHVISQVTFPVYSKMQDDIPRLRVAYLRVLGLTAFLSFPAAGLIFMLAPDFTQIFLGDKWMPMVPAMQLLCIFGVTRSIGATMGSILYGVGRPKTQAKLSSIQLFVLALIIYPLTIQWGIWGTSLAVVISNSLALVLITREVRNIMGFIYKEFLIGISVPLCGVIVMISALYLKVSLLPTDINLLNFLIIGVLSCIVYFGMIYVLDRSTGYKLQQEIRGLFGNLEPRWKVI